MPELTRAERVENGASYCSRGKEPMKKIIAVLIVSLLLALDVTAPVSAAPLMGQGNYHASHMRQNHTMQHHMNQGNNKHQYNNKQQHNNNQNYNNHQYNNKQNYNNHQYNNKNYDNHQYNNHQYNNNQNYNSNHNYNSYNQKYNSHMYGSQMYGSHMYGSQNYNSQDYNSQNYNSNQNYNNNQMYSSANPSKTAVSINNFAFNPQVLTVTVGTTVTWTNMQDIPHTTTSDTKVWDSGNLAPGASFSYQFTKEGTFTYHCSIHPNMTGTIVVTK